MTVSLPKNVITISIGGFLALLTLVALVLYPLIKNMQAAADKLVGVQQELALFHDGSGNPDYIQETHAKIAPDRERFDTLFVNPDVPLDVIQFLEKTASASEITITIAPSGKSTAQEDTDPWPSIGFQLRLVSTFPDLLQFLEKIENGPHLVQLQDVAASRINERELALEEYQKYTLDDVRATVTVKVFTD